MTDAAGDWLRFAQTGSIYDYLTYKTNQSLNNWLILFIVFFVLIGL